MSVILAMPRVIQVELKLVESSQGKTGATIVADKADLGYYPPFGESFQLEESRKIKFTLSVTGGSGVITIQSGEWPRGCGPMQQHLLGSTGQAYSQRIGIRYVDPDRAIEAQTKMAFEYNAAGLLTYKSANINAEVDLAQVHTKVGASTYYIALEVAPGATGTLEFIEIDDIPTSLRAPLKSIKV